MKTNVFRSKDKCFRSKEDLFRNEKVKDTFVFTPPHSFNSFTPKKYSFTPKTLFFRLKKLRFSLSFGRQRLKGRL